MSKRKVDDTGSDPTNFLSPTAVLEIEEDSHVEYPSSGSESDTEFPELDSASDSDTSQNISGEDEGHGAAFQKSIRPMTVVSRITGESKRQYPDIEPEYDSDSSTEEDLNRIGNVPPHWYDDLPHVGYTIDGKQILRPAKGDELDKFLATVEDPNSWSTAFDEKLQMESPLSTEELDIIRRLQQGEIPDKAYNPYEPTVEWFTGKGKEESMPLNSAPEPKRRWVASKWEKQKVMKIVHAIRQGRIVPSKSKSVTNGAGFFNLWSSSEPVSQALPPLPAPRKRLPTHSESYNPPPEYLPDDTERVEWENTAPEDKERDYLPQSFPAFRQVPAYENFVRERFDRQLDLYLAPRIQRKKLDIDADSLIPKLPSPSSLRPYPLYKGLRVVHKGLVRCAAISPDGNWVATADNSGVVCLWEMSVGNSVKQWTYEEAVSALEWCPRRDCNFLLLAVGNSLHALIPPGYSTSIQHATSELLASSELRPAQEATGVSWISPSSQSDCPLIIRLPSGSGNIKQIIFHRKGDYVSTVSSGEGQIAIWIHQISKRHSQTPFNKVKGLVQRVLFHPQKPVFFVATQRHIRMYDLAAQKLVKTLQPGLRWISSIDVHSSGDHLIVGGYDKKLCWFDLELSDKPYKVLRYHSKAIRAVAFHPAYPLFASCSDDGTIQIFHGRVYNDLMTDPLIVPLKILRGHQVTNGLGVLDLKWCQTEPWLVSCGADGTASTWFS